MNPNDSDTPPSEAKNSQVAKEDQRASSGTRPGEGATESGATVDRDQSNAGSQGSGRQNKGSGAQDDPSKRGKADIGQAELGKDQTSLPNQSTDQGSHGPPNKPGHYEEDERTRPGHGDSGRKV